MLRCMTAQQFDLWMTYYGMGYPRRMEEIHNARLVHTQAMVWGEQGSDPRIEEYLPENIAYERMLEQREAARRNAERANETIANFGEALLKHYG